MNGMNIQNNMNIGIELSSISVVSGSDARGACWKNNVSSEFPIIPVNISDGEIELLVDSPHNGYKIQTMMKNGRMNGESCIINDKSVVIAMLVFVDGVAEGNCTLYDNNGIIFFKGSFVNGYREGYGKEFDENGNMVYEGFFKHGLRMNIVEMKEMKGYYKEVNDANEVISICQKNEDNENDGICYFYVNGKIHKVSEWESGKELSILKRFEGEKMIEFEDGLKQYEGEYRDSVKDGYLREGNGKEYDVNGEKVIYEGYFWNGKRQGNGKLYRNGDRVYNGVWVKGHRLNGFVLMMMLMMIVMIVISILLELYIGVAVLVIDIICWIGVWFCFPSIQAVFGCKKGKKSKTLQMKNDLKYAKQLNYLTCSLLVMLLVNIIAILIPIFLILSYQSIQKECLGSNVVGSMVIESNHCNDPFISIFNPQNDDINQIMIGDDCFNSVSEFDVNGLSKLKSVIIGKNSFGRSEFGSFHLLNCSELQLIRIGSDSFNGFVELFELKNLPILSSISLGKNVFEKSLSMIAEGMNVVFDSNRSSCVIYNHFVRK